MMDNENSTPLVRLFPDFPVRHSKDLSFDFKGLARTLAELAWNGKNDTPFTVVVRGGWGCGKTTLLKAAERAIKGENGDEGASKVPAGSRKVKTLWFNAWKYPDEDSVLAGLLGALIDELRAGGMLDQLKILVETNKGRLLKQIVKRSSPAAYDILFEGSESPPLSTADEARAFYDTFRSLFGRFSYVWLFGKDIVRDNEHRPIERLWQEKQQDGVLAVFLDDLDRCHEKRVLEVLKTISLFQDLPGVCFFLGLDWERLTKILEQSLEEDSERFLEKIVQVSLELPQVSEEQAQGFIEGLVRQGDLAAVITGSESDGEEIKRSAVVIASVMRQLHPRRVKRFLNDLSVHFAVLRNVGRLGDGEGKIPHRAVVCWHLLRGTLDPDRWRTISSALGNLDPFLRDWKTLGQQEKEERKESLERLGHEAVQMHERGAMAPYIEALSGLDVEQRKVLLHLGAPARSTGSRVVPAGSSVDLSDLAGFAWVEILGGSFEMGAADIDRSEPVHKVAVSDFRMARYPVTNAEYERFLSAVESTSIGPPLHWKNGEIPPGKEHHPVTQVSWHEASAFCKWLNEEVSQADGQVALPTEAQWEFAARGEEGRRYPWGDEPEPGETLANFMDNVGDTTPVSAYPAGATPEGIHDLVGNVWEWCADWYGGYGPGHSADPPGPEQGSFRVLRGGAFCSDPLNLRAAYRYFNHPVNRYNFIGFRVAWSPVEGR